MNPHRSSVGLDLESLWNRRHLLVACVVGFVAVGLAYLLLTPPSYEAEARVLVQSDGLVFDRAEDRLKDKAFLATQGEVLASPLTIGRALESTPIALPPSDKDPIEVVRKELEVSPLVETDVLRIRFRSSVEGEAPRFIRGLLDAFRKDAAEASRNEFAESIELLRAEERQVRGELETVQSEYLTLRDREEVDGLAGDGADHLLRELANRLAETRNRRVELERRLGVLERLTAEPVAVETDTIPRRRPSSASVVQLLLDEKVLAVEAIAELRRRRSEAEQRRALLAGYGPRHPGLRGVQEEIRVLDETLAARVADASRALEQEYELALASERELERLHSEAAREARRANEFELREQLLVTNIDRLTRLHETTLQRLSDFRLADGAVGKGRATVHVRVLEGPELTEKKVWPLPLPILGACFVLGTAIGLGLVSLLDGIGSTPAPAIAVTVPEEERLSDIHEDVEAARTDIAASRAGGLRTTAPRAGGAT